MDDPQRPIRSAHRGGLRTRHHQRPAPMPELSAVWVSGFGPRLRDRLLLVHVEAAELVL